MNLKSELRMVASSLCHWDGTEETEAKIKEDTQATIRCVPFYVRTDRRRGHGEWKAS